MNTLSRITAFLFAGLAGLSLAAPARSEIVHDTGTKAVLMSTADQSLVLGLDYDGKCLLSRVRVRGHDMVPPNTGVCTGIQVAGEWQSTRAQASPRVEVKDNRVEVTGLTLHCKGVELTEQWTFAVQPDRILWRIARQYLSGGTLEDTYFPGFDFNDGAWTGALLGTGGVAWFKMLGKGLATYGAHTGPVTFWNEANHACLRIVPTVPSGGHLATRFSHHPHGVVSFNYTASSKELETQHGQWRFLRDRLDVWRPFDVAPGETVVELALSGLDYSQAYDRGNLRGLDGKAIGEICNTIARLGVIDAKIAGSNGWPSGFAVLHEQWVAQLGLAIDDPAYFQSYADALDYQRDFAIGADGRVKSRWSCAPGDDMPGTYDPRGFYECQWGWLMDAQPAYVTNVAEQFDFSGDVAWVRRHQASCEKALDYLLRRDSNGNGLVEMINNQHSDKKSSDWIDIVWAAFENGLVNAEMYNALQLWADVEALLGDSSRAGQYRQAAAKLKAAFNLPVAEGGLWDPQHRCYAYWRDRDGSIHGTNLVTPVNFMAVAYHICDDPQRRSAILDQIENQMQAEKLFFWPLCLFSYQPEEGGGGPFPTYENGDIFLGWGELGTRAYASYKPAVALRMVRNVIDRYDRDGLAFQRYLRKTQAGAGDDILSNMASPIVGLYRNIYGVQPRWNRLCLDPHLTTELAGTQLKYWLRGQSYVIDLKPDDYAVAASQFTLREKRPFGVDMKDQRLCYFGGARQTPSMTLDRSESASLQVSIEQWPTGPEGARRWTEKCDRANVAIKHSILDLGPSTVWRWSRSAAPAETLHADGEGRIFFDHVTTETAPTTFDLRPANGN